MYQFTHSCTVNAGLAQAAEQNPEKLNLAMKLSSNYNYKLYYIWAIAILPYLSDEVPLDEIPGYATDAYV